MMTSDAQTTAPRSPDPHTIAILGAGRVATNLATKLAGAGHDLVFGVVNPSGDGASWKGPPAPFLSPADAIRRASVVIHATPGDSALERLSALREELRGKILIDVSNATERGPDGAPGGLTYPNSSLAEHLQAALPETAVVKTLNTMLYTVMTNPGGLATPPTAFLSGNDAGAKAIVRGLLGDLGWRPEWIEDLGDVTTARGTEALILLVPYVVRARGFAPFALIVAR